MNVKKLRISIFLLVLLSPSVILADVPSASHEEKQSILNRFTHRVAQTWNDGGLDLYLPVYTWHNRIAYDSHKISKYNENPWGGGIGRSIVDEDGDTHALYFMGFQDSNDHFQPIMGYGFFKNAYLNEKRDFAVSIGFTLSVTARHEYDYIPLPLPLPLVGIQYKDLALQAAYIPGGKNNGNVLFAWVRWSFD